MALWSDLALWRGPTPNRTDDGLKQRRGLVVHIADGWYDGTIAWQRNKGSKVSSHFVVSRAGDIAQIVDTDDAAWTQKAGNSTWLSVECEGFSRGHELNPGGWEKLTSEQIDAVARLLARCHREYGVPLQSTSSATGLGLGHHSMGADWGHKECPGKPIIGQKAAIVRRAKAIENGDDMNLDDSLPLTEYARRTWDIEGLDVKTALSHDYIYSRAASDRAAEIAAELKAAKLRQEAILAAFKGLNTSSIIEAIRARSEEDAARDAAILESVSQLASGGATAAAIVDELHMRLGPPHVQ